VAGEVETVFGKKKATEKEEPTITKVQEATGEEPLPPVPELTPVQYRVQGLVRRFDESYSGVVGNAPDHVRANLLFAIYGELSEVIAEQVKTNALLEELVELSKR
jgi:hypothetical protein